MFLVNALLIEGFKKSLLLSAVQNFVRDDRTDTSA